MSFLRCLFTLFLLAATDHSFASTLRISGDSDIRLEIAGDEYRLIGWYQITNEGEEPVFNVFPAFELGNLRWNGKPLDLALGATHRWEFNLAVPRQSMACVAPIKGELACLEESFPAKGNIPLKILRNYQDLNHHPMSVIEPFVLKTPDLMPSEEAELQTGLVAATLSVQSDGQTFHGELEIKNNSKKEIKGIVSLVLPTEFDAPERDQRVIVRPDSSLRIPIKGRNLRGTPGSRYQIGTLVQWPEGDLRRVVRNIVDVSVFFPDDRNLLFIAGAIILVAAFLFVLCAAALRKPNAVEKPTDRTR